MFRFKVTVTLTVIIVLLTAVVYFLLPSKLEADRRGAVIHGLQVAATSLERTERLDDFAVIKKATDIAEFEPLVTSMTDDYEGNYAYQRHLGVYNKGLLRWKFAFENLKLEKEKVRNVELPLEQRRPFVPELLFVTDENGIGVAALGINKYDWYNENMAKAQPGLLDAIKAGKSSKDIWLWKWGEGQSEEMYHVGIAPVMQGSEKAVGIVVVGTLLSGSVAELASEHIGGYDVAYFGGKRVVASTLDKDRDEVLASVLFGDDSPLKSDSMVPDPVEIEVGGKSYLAAVRYYASDEEVEGPRPGFIVMADLDEGLELVSQVRLYTIIFGIISLILLLSSVTFLVYLFVKPLEHIDQGIQEVIAGNKDYVFAASGSFGGEMAQSLNLMSAFLQGKKMPDEDEEGGEGQWSEFMVSEVSQTGMMRAVHAKDVASSGAKSSGNVVGVPMMGGAAAPAPEVAEAPAEDRDTYLKRIFGEYVEAKKNTGADVSEITFESFVQRLDKNAEKLKEKHKAKDIQFSVIVRDGKVVLKPTPVF